LRVVTVRTVRDTEEHFPITILIAKYIDINISQNTTQFYAQYIQYISQLHGPKHVVVRYIVHIVHKIVLCFH
jgi:hypothetical protein